MNCRIVYSFLSVCVFLLRTRERWRSIVISASVCVCVCLSVCPRAHLPYHTRDLNQFLCMLRGDDIQRGIGNLQPMAERVCRDRTIRASGRCGLSSNYFDHLLLLSLSSSSSSPSFSTTVRVGINNVIYMTVCSSNCENYYHKYLNCSIK